jgi:hypothetical protein
MIVFATHADPVGVGQVTSPPRPGGNITGPAFWYGIKGTGLGLSDFARPRRRSDRVKRGYVRSCHFRGGNVCEGQLTGQMQSWYQDLLEDRLTHCGHSLEAVFRLTADRSNPLVALKRSTRIVDRLETARS